MAYELIHGDCIEVMQKMEDDSVDAIVQDPPYGLGFMGKEWDALPPGLEWAKEALRVLKPGGYLLSFGGARTYHRLVCAIEDAGFEIRDQIMWLYGSGFPKSHSVSKAIDKAAGAEREPMPDPQDARRNTAAREFWSSSDPATPVVTAPATPEAEQWDGWGTALKPAHEPIVVARKPFKGTVAENVLEHGTGAMNIDDCRIVTGDNLDGGAYSKGEYDTSGKVFELGLNRLEGDYEQPKGRWPANLILSHHDDCVRKGMKVVKGDGHAPKLSKGNPFGGVNDQEHEERYFKDEVIDDYNCHPECPLSMLDEQSGVSKSSASVRKNRKRNDDNIYGGGKGIPQIDLTSPHSDEGGASRFFYCAKANQSERNKGCDDLPETPYAPSNQAQAELKRGNLDFNAWEGKEHSERNNHNHVGSNRNFHPTVKPVALMRWLCRLVTPPGGTVLDPFMGSGTTIIAADLEGFNAIGIELDEDYLEIARHRIEHWVEEKEERIAQERAQLSLFDW